MTKQIQKTSQKLEPFQLTTQSIEASKDRKIFSLKVSRPTTIKNNLNNNIIVEPKKEEIIENHHTIQEEEPIVGSNSKNEEAKSISEIIINKLFHMTNLEEARNMLQITLKEYHST